MYYSLPLLSDSTVLFSLAHYKSSVLSTGVVPFQPIPGLLLDGLSYTWPYMYVCICV